MKRWTTWLLWGALVLAVAMGVARALNARKTQQAAAAEAAQALRANAQRVDLVIELQAQFFDLTDFFAFA